MLELIINPYSPKKKTIFLDQECSFNKDIPVKISTKEDYLIGTYRSLFNQESLLLEAVKKKTVLIYVDNEWLIVEICNELKGILSKFGEYSLISYHNNDNPRVGLLEHFIYPNDPFIFNKTLLCYKVYRNNEFLFWMVKPE